MPLITVQHPPEALNQAKKDALAEELTKVILEIEGGADTPEGRYIAWVRFQPIERSDWYLGGVNDSTFEAKAGRWLIELNVPEGSMDQERKSESHRAITTAILKATGFEGDIAAAGSVWIQIVEWPEGHLATRGRTASLFGIAKLAKIPPDFPLLQFGREYFAAKDRMLDAHAFPAKTAGRRIVRD
jgi:phenylpyruvate tautomerase PptA (4-oxalocrotonate tautomerase family)